MMVTYFSIFAKEGSMVAKDQGFANAYASVAFATDLIPRLVLSAIFGQLQFLAYPLKTNLPTISEEAMVEEFCSSLPCHQATTLRHTFGPQSMN
jgi:hypothetical protein